MEDWHSIPGTIKGHICLGDTDNFVYIIQIVRKTLLKTYIVWQKPKTVRNK